LSEADSVVFPTSKPEISVESDNSKVTAVNVAVHVVAPVTSTVVDSSDEESGVAPALQAQLVNRYPAFAVAEIDHVSSPSSVAVTVPPPVGVFATVTIKAESSVKVAVQVVAAVAVTFVVMLTIEFGV